MLKFETKVTHYIDYFDWDDFIERKFPNCDYDCIASEEELGNDSTWSTSVDGDLGSEKNRREIEDYLEGNESGDFCFVSTRDILNYLVAEGILPPGNYNINISW